MSKSGVVYSLAGGNPLLFDPDGRGDYLLPSVYALWLLPHMLPTIFTHTGVRCCTFARAYFTSHEHQVSTKVLGGADLFLQGVIVPPEGPPSLAAGDIVSIAIPDNPRHPFAIGVMHISTADAVDAGWKGKGVRLLHVLGDGLWALGDRVLPHPSVTLSQIHPLPASPPDMDDADVRGLTLADDKVGGVLQGEEDDAHATAPDAGPVTCPADMDALLEGTLLRALAAMPDSALPILSSDLYSRFILPNRPAGMVVQFGKMRFAVGIDPHNFYQLSPPCCAMMQYVQ